MCACVRIRGEDFKTITMQAIQEYHPMYPNEVEDEAEGCDRLMKEQNSRAIRTGFLGVVYGRTCRSHSTTLHVARFPFRSCDDMDCTLLSTSCYYASPPDSDDDNNCNDDETANDVCCTSMNRKTIETNEERAGPILVRLQFPVTTTSTPQITALRSYCRRFCKQGDLILVQDGDSIDSNFRLSNIATTSVASISAGKLPQLVVQLQNVERVQQCIQTYQTYYWTMKQCQIWQGTYQRIAFNDDDGYDDDDYQRKAVHNFSTVSHRRQHKDVHPRAANHDCEARVHHGSALSKQIQARFVVSFLIRMIMAKLKQRENRVDQDLPRLGFSSFVLLDSGELSDKTSYNQALAYLNEGCGVLDVAGGAGRLAMTLGLAGIKSTVIDPRPNVGRLSSRERKMFRNQMACRPPIDGRQQAIGIQQSGDTTRSESMTSQPCTNFHHLGTLDCLFDCQPVVDFVAYQGWFGVPPPQVDTSFRHPKKRQLPICDHNHALLQQCRAIVALHPDEATDSIVDLAISHRIPFCIVPCCVFNRLFPHRRNPVTGEPVNTYDDLLAYLAAKHPSITRCKLPFEGKNVLLWSSFSETTET